MNKIVGLMVVAVVALGFNACDTRDDYIVDHCDEPTVKFIVPDSDTVTVDGQRYIRITLNWNETRTYDFSLVDKYGGVSGITWNVTGVTTPFKDEWGRPGGYVRYDSAMGRTLLSYAIKTNFDAANDKISFTENWGGSDPAVSDVNHKGVNFFLNLGSGDLRYSEDVDSTEITLRGDFYNKLGVKGYANVILVLQPNRPPKPEIEVTQISGMEYTISAAKSTDPNGKEIAYYEYLIDGKPISEAGYIWETNKNCQEGYAAVGGTYIQCTSLTSVSHAFQTTGQHKVYVRCADKWGLWSKWVEKEVTI